MSDPPPKLASEILDSGFPALLRYGEKGEAWIVLRNEGQYAWKNGEFWLEAESAWKGARSALYDPSQWPAFNVAALLDHAVDPGDTVIVRIPLLAGQLPNVSDGWYQEAFHLVSRQGLIVKCPSARLQVSIRAMSVESHDGGAAAIGTDGAADVDGNETPDGSTDGSDSAGGCCAVHPGHYQNQTPCWLMVAGVAIMILRKKASSTPYVR